MKTDRTICLNSKVGGVQPSLQDRIYDVEGCSTAITTSFLPSIAEPRIIEVGRVKEGKHQQDFVQHERGICHTICTGHHASTPHLLKTLVSDPFIVAMRDPNVLTPKRTEYGKAMRKKYENHEIDISRHYMQQLEPRTDGVSNTLTSVQKDNLLAEPLRIREATAQGYAEASEGDSVNLAVPNSTTRRGRVGKQMANTLDTGCQQGVVVSDDWQTVVGNKQMNPFRGSVDNEAPCITSACGAGGGMTPMATNADMETTKTQDFIEQVRGHQEMRYRIRKLTPTECFRLMGVDDEDIEKLKNASISNSQLYKCAGNSIVVDVLYHLFRKMYVDKGCELENHQQTLF